MLGASTNILSVARHGVLTIPVLDFGRKASQHDSPAPVMRHIAWALLALVAYSAVPPLMRHVTQEIPSDVAVVVTNGMLTIAAIGLVLATEKPFLPALTHQRAPAMYVAGIALAVGIVAFYRALAAGPVSVVVPIFGLFIATSSIVGVLVLEEPVTLRKGLGITLAVVAVYLTAVE